MGFLKDEVVAQAQAAARALEDDAKSSVAKLEAQEQLLFGAQSALSRENEKRITVGEVFMAQRDQLADEASEASFIPDLGSNGPGLLIVGAVVSVAIFFLQVRG